MQSSEEPRQIIPTITATHLRRDLGAVLDAVLSGETIKVERNGRPLVVLVPPAEYDRLAAAMTTTNEEHR